MILAHKVVLACALAALVSNANAAVEFLSMNSLPSTNGWTFAATNVVRSEAATASVSGGFMTFSTMGSGNQPGGSSIRYTKTITPDWTQSWYIESTMRLNAFESFSNFIGTYFGSNVLWVGVSPGRLTFSDLSFINYTPGNDFHTFRFEVQTNEAWTFYADNVPLKTGTLGVGSGNITLAIGDGSGGSNGNATYDYYRFDQPIPAPMSAGAIGTALCAVMLKRRR